MPRIRSPDGVKVALVEDCLLFQRGQRLVLKKTKSRNRLTFSLAVDPLVEPLLPTEDRFAQPFPLASFFFFLHLLVRPEHSRPSPRLVPPRAKLLIKLDHLVDGVRQDGRHRQELREVMPQARNQRREQQRGELVLRRSRPDGFSFSQQVWRNGSLGKHRLTTASMCSKPFVSRRYWISSPRKRSCAVRRLSTNDRGYSGWFTEQRQKLAKVAGERTILMGKSKRTLSMRFVPRDPSNCHLKRSKSGCTSGCSANKGFGLLDEAETDWESLLEAGIGLLACLRPTHARTRRMSSFRVRFARENHAQMFESE